MLVYLLLAMLETHLYNTLNAHKRLGSDFSVRHFSFRCIFFPTIKKRGLPDDKNVENNRLVVFFGQVGRGCFRVPNVYSVSFLFVFFHVVVVYFRFSRLLTVYAAADGKPGRVRALLLENTLFVAKTFTFFFPLSFLSFLVYFCSV